MTGAIYVFSSKPIIQRLKQYKKAYDIIAKRVGVNADVFTRWMKEPDSFDPNLEQLTNMAKMFDISLTELLSMGYAATPSAKSKVEDEGIDLFNSEPIITRLKNFKKAYDVLAERIDVDTEVFYQWIKKPTKFDPTLKQFVNIAKMFDITPVELMSIGYTPAAKASARTTATRKRTTKTTAQKTTRTTRQRTTKAAKAATKTKATKTAAAKRKKK